MLQDFCYIRPVCIIQKFEDDGDACFAFFSFLRRIRIIFVENDVVVSYLWTVVS